MGKLLPVRKVGAGAIAMQAWVVVQLALSEFAGFELSPLLASESTALLGLAVAYFTPAPPAK